MYFVGVTTTKSSIMKLFPRWAKELGLDDAVLTGIDLAIHADPEEYRRVVGFLKDDPLSLGALVTTHKIDLYNAAKDLFEFLDPYARMFGELSSISKKGGRLEGFAKDPISSGKAMEAFIPEGFWKRHGGDVFIMGAGGSAIAVGAHLMARTHVHASASWHGGPQGPGPRPYPGDGDVIDGEFEEVREDAPAKPPHQRLPHDD